MRYERQPAPPRPPGLGRPEEAPAKSDCPCLFSQIWLHLDRQPLACHASALQACSGGPGVLGSTEKPGLLWAVPDLVVLVTVPGPERSKKSGRSGLIPASLYDQDCKQKGCMGLFHELRPQRPSRPGVSSEARKTGCADSLEALRANRDGPVRPGLGPPCQ